jgi:glycine/D-amino acid oxidase-like deaminating enzyme
MSAQTPGDAFPRQGSKHSWVFNYDRGFDYLTQLSEGQMMLGGGFAQSEHHGLADLGVSIDSEISLNMDIHLSGVLAAVFGRKNWGRVQGDPIQAMWTGIMAMSSDNVPWVGRLPEVFTRRADHGEEGSEWVCAAFSGEGMVQAWLSGKALGTMLLERDRVLVGDAVDLSWFPEQYCVSEKRFGETELPKEVVVEH